MCECAPELTAACSSAWGWTRHPLQTSVCPSSPLLSSTLRFYIQFPPGFPLLLVPLLSAGHQWKSLQFLPGAIYYRNRLTVAIFEACAP